MSDRGTLKVGEPHPAVKDAIAYMQSLSLEDITKWLAAFSSCSIEGNRFGEVCAETMRRLSDGEPVSDRYLLGLAFAILHGEGKKS